METEATQEDLLELVLEMIQNGTLESFSGEPVPSRVRATNHILQIIRQDMAQQAIMKIQQDNPNMKWAKTYREALTEAMACVDFASAMPKDLVETADRVGLKLHPTLIAI